LEWSFLDLPSIFMNGYDPRPIWAARSDLATYNTVAWFNQASVSLAHLAIRFADDIHV